MKVFGRELWIERIAAEHWAWMEKQIRRVEQSVYGSTRPEVEEYLLGFIRRAGGSRTVGRELGPTSVDSR